MVADVCSGGFVNYSAQRDILHPVQPPDLLTTARTGISTKENSS